MSRNTLDDPNNSPKKFYYGKDPNEKAIATSLLSSQVDIAICRTDLKI